MLVIQQRDPLTDESGRRFLEPAIEADRTVLGDLPPGPNTEGSLKSDGAARRAC